MWQRLTFYDLRVIGHYLGVLTLFFTIGLAIPFVVALAFGEWEPASRYLTAMGVTLLVGSALRFCRVQPGRLTRKQALVVTGLAWIIFALYAALPLFFSGHYSGRPLDALFEGVSGLTTTGASVVTDLEHLSYADNMWRFVMHLIGGLGLIVVGLTFGLFGKGAGASLFASEGRNEHVVPNVVQTAKFIGRIAVVFIVLSTVIIAVLCSIIGMEPVRAVTQALWLSISAFMTGGFTPMSGSVAYYQSFAIEFVLMVVMLAGTVNFVLHFEVLRGHVSEFFRDMETKTGGVWLVLMVAIMALSLAGTAAASGSGANPFSDLPIMLRRGVFMAVSAFSTTGFLNVSSDQLAQIFPSGAFLVLVLLMAVGSTSGSTAGGIKLNRLLMIAKSAVVTIKKTIAPDSARVVVSYYHLGRRTVTPTLISEAMTVSVLYIAAFIVGALLGVAYGNDATQALFESIAMASNGGITTGSLISPGSIPAPLEIYYIFEMWAGRLEFVTLLALIAQIGVSLVPRPLGDWWYGMRAKRRR